MRSLRSSVLSHSKCKEGQTKELNLIIKVDVQGTLQPIIESLQALSPKGNEGIKINILAAEVGNVSESDVMLASASGATIIAFTVAVDTAARRAAESQHVEVRQYDIIYKMLEDIELALKGMLDPVYAEKTIGVAEVRRVFKISRVGAIAGCYIREGEARRNAKARVKRGSQVLIASTGIESLKREKEDVREVRSGFECGIGLATFSDFQVGDSIEFFVTERVS